MNTQPRLEPSAQATLSARPRVVLAVGSVAAVAVVNITGIALAPAGLGLWLGVCAVVAVAAALQSVAWEPADLMPALLFSLPPVVAVAAGGAHGWLVGPLGALLLVAAELNSLGWDAGGAAAVDGVLRRRMRELRQLGACALLAAVAVQLAASVPSPPGLLAVLIAAAALAALARLLFGRRA